ncbi:hemin-degrading factor [Fodinibius salsisoli]|uniref:Haemin-degrading HemS/ChuX domain-containing protein n=1 Tax=Fodinibius salsisoli TaxID=2820877 RepID=A0ABT3PNW5_9BACT|nr:ChuX/HutX family heme-like substrate-binding protein [Fodinibius salsisoli]MCW9707549.1 hypothetical protein [Fodinibius salsisoli]
MNATTLSLSKQWNELKIQNPKLRTRQAADQLGVSEAELLASTCDGDSCVRLMDSWKDILKAVESLGYVMALTRNEAAVHEKKGIYQNFKLGNHVGLVLDENIDLRIFFDHWHFGFAAEVENPRGTLYSLQFFDRDGTAVHKIYLMNDDQIDEYQQLVEQFSHPNQQPGLEVEPLSEPEPYKTLDEIDHTAFLQSWSELKDTHDFHPMLKKFNIKRTDALRIAEQEFSYNVDPWCTQHMLRMAATREVPIMVFVRSQGVIQIHTGPVQNIRMTGDWFNILDPEFNLHLRKNLFHSAWIVQKPTEDGIVTSLEVFDADEEQVVTFFGARKPGKAELKGWRSITKELIE